MKIAASLAELDPRITPHIVSELFTDRITIEPAHNARGEPRFGPGTAYPVRMNIFTIMRIYYRVAKLAIIKGTNFTHGSRVLTPGESTDYVSQIGEHRTGPGGTAFHRFQLVCGMGATVSQLGVRKQAGQPIDWDGTIGPAPDDYWTSAGFTFAPFIVTPDDPTLIEDSAPDVKEPIWKNYNLYMPISAGMTAYVGNSQIVGMTSDIESDQPCQGRERYQKVGECIADFRDQTKEGQDPKLEVKFPMYRDVWGEDGSFPEDCGGSTSPASYYTVSGLLKIAYIDWDTPGEEAAVTPEMSEVLDL